MFCPWVVVLDGKLAAYADTRDARITQLNITNHRRC